MLKKAFPWLQDRSEPEEPGKEIIRGEKVILRAKRLEDAPDDYAWRTDEELARLDATKPLRMSYEDFLKYSREEISYSSPSSKRVAIDDLEGRHIGNCMYYDIDLRRRHTELGIMIGDRNYWGRGYGTDSVEALLTHIFTTTPLNRVYLHTLEWNQRARRSFAKSGLHELKNVRRSGMDFVLMEIMRSEWDSLTSVQQNVNGHSQPGDRQDRPHDGAGTPTTEAKG